MRKVISNIAILAAAIVLAGCSSGLLGGKSHVQQASNVPTGNELTLPPDLQLRPPGQTTSAYQANPAPVAPEQTAAVEDDAIYSTAGATPAQPAQDIYAKYGISKLRPNGTPKEQWELKAELKAAILAEKRKTDPGYGTVFNVGGLFKDD